MYENRHLCLRRKRDNLSMRDVPLSLTSKDYCALRKCGSRSTTFCLTFVLSNQRGHIATLNHHPSTLSRLSLTFTFFPFHVGWTIYLTTCNDVHIVPLPDVSILSLVLLRSHYLAYSLVSWSYNIELITWDYLEFNKLKTYSCGHYWKGQKLSIRLRNT